MLRTKLYADPNNLFLHDVILESCRRNANKTALVDVSSGRRLTYGEYGELVESVARGLVAAGLRPGEVVAIFLPNSWEFCTAFHAIQLAGGLPTPLNPTYREREVRYQIENSGAAMLIADGCNLEGIDLSGLPTLRKIYVTRQPAAGADSFGNLLKPHAVNLPKPAAASGETLGTLPYSSGTTGLPKGVMLSHYNLVANIFQLLAPNTTRLGPADTILCCLPLYHIYGLNVILNPVLVLGGTLVLVPRFQVQQCIRLLRDEYVTMMPLVPPAMSALCEAAEAGQFPRDHNVSWVKCGAAPLAPELARRFTALTDIPICQGYGMTEASPVTHIGFLDPEFYRPDSIGHPVAMTDCRVLSESDIDPGEDLDDVTEAPCGQPGELIMRGPQFMLGYWNEPQATAAVLRDGWYWSGDIVTRDREGFYRVVDRRKEMIKFKGFSVAPAEVEAVMLEHPAVKECGVVGRADADAGEIPVAFVALREGFTDSQKLGDELCAFVADRLTHYKQPREVLFVPVVPKTASGKILRRELRKILR
jgi:long-chain acyl-CoA synthetase